jgi:hypothetical protein
VNRCALLVGVAGVAGLAGCSELVVRIGDGGTATVSLVGKTVSYGQDG